MNSYIPQRILFNGMKICYQQGMSHLDTHDITAYSKQSIIRTFVLHISLCTECENVVPWMYTWLLKSCLKFNLYFCKDSPIVCHVDIVKERIHLSFETDFEKYASWIHWTYVTIFVDRIPLVVWERFTMDDRTQCRKKFLNISIILFPANLRNSYEKFLIFICYQNSSVSLYSLQLIYDCSYICI